MVGITKMKAEKQKAEKEAFFCTTKELSRLGLEQIPTQFQSHKHLIYSSPATLAFNSPGAEGFGVKRAGLAVPDSIMLIVAPGCCGRNTSLISSMKEYNDRFYYLMMDETDIVTGRHLKKIPKAVEEICRHEGLADLLKKQYEAGKWIAAICAAPSVFGGLGFLKDKEATSYPGCLDGIPVGGYKEDPVVVDGNVVTSRGVGTAIAFALKLIEVLISKEKAEEIAASIIYSV